ncbi:MAG: photosystem II reaction center protein PsbN [Cyanobacteria bacterium QS_8_64_29]|jgi:PsbN protein|nr:MAG: photosystem II reaction center protein PsbN [Cyanobacteria bacterium QS_8_64_29]
MEPATAISVTIAAVVVGVTGYAIYMAFGPPAAELSDPFEEHEE